MNNFKYEDCKSYIISEDQYNYLLPAIKSKLSNREYKQFYFIGNYEELYDMERRLIGIKW